MIRGEEVTPHVGVWIETLRHVQGFPLLGVTPHVGVWIETFDNYNMQFWQVVTPHVGVWIETDDFRLSDLVRASHLM